MLCRGRGWRRAQAGLFGLSAAVLAAWAVQQFGDGLAEPALALAAAALAFAMVAGAAHHGLRAAATTLCWDGQQWSAHGHPQPLQLMLHSGAFVLLRLRSPSGTRWLAVERVEAGAAWHGLLVALHATPGAAGALAPEQGQGH